MNPALRKYLYGVGIAVLAVLAVYGVVGKEELPTWVLLVGAVFGVGTNGLAIANVPARGPRSVE